LPELDETLAGRRQIQPVLALVYPQGTRALDHNIRAILAYVFGKRKDTVFEELKTLLEPFCSAVSIRTTGVLTNALLFQIRNFA